MKNLNSIEELEMKTNNLVFIKSYPTLTKLFPNSLLKINVIQLVLSYQKNDKDFYMSYSRIADIFTVKTQSVRNTINALVKEGYLICDNNSNYNPTTGFGGSTTSIQVNEEKLVQDIQDKMAGVTPNQVKEQSNPNIPTKKVIAREEVISIEEPKPMKISNTKIENKTSNEFNSFLEDNIPSEKVIRKEVPQFNSEEVIIGKQQHKEGGSRLKDFLNSIDINNIEDNRTQVVK